MTSIDIAQTEYERLVALQERAELLDCASGVGLWEAVLFNGDPMHEKSKWTWSPEFRRLIGFESTAEFPNRVESWSNRLHPDDVDATFAAFATSLEDRSDRGSYNVKYRLQMRDGSYRWFHATGGCKHAANGTIRACGSLSDVHDAVTATLAVEQDTAADTNALGSIQRALSALAQGDLSHTITQKVPEKMQLLKDDFNQATRALSALMGRVLETVEGISEVSNSMRGASRDLHTRSVKQASSLEETSAAVVEIAGTVKQTADVSRESAKEARLNKTRSDECGAIVQNAIVAMGEIEESSGKITGIISTIENIAFQTNMLALNAAVEAARAGEAGRGFAVVAAEVRDLAQRSTDAAREITTLIMSSKAHVSEGADLVNKTGTALAEIAEGVDHISEAITGISDAASEQSSALSEIERAVSNIDQLNQRNTEMSEQNDTVAESLRASVAELSNLLARFKLAEARTQRMIKMAS